ncbi:MAG: TonB-dependent receptor [Myxococcales bacterium]|nr:TonB-dependent receptor [Myxococcales bacterium]
MIRRAKPHWAALLGAAFALGASALPQIATAQVTDPEDEAIEEMIVVGVKMGALPMDATSFSSEIDLQRFEGEQRRLEDLLAQTVGVQLRRFGGPGERAEISIRGFASSQVVVQLDGMTLNNGMGGGVDLSSIPLAQLESVSVTRGGSSLRAGSGAMGGVVELRTRRPDFPSQLASAQAGSFNTYDVSFYRTQPGRVADLGFGYSGFRTDGDFEFARVETRLPSGQIILPSTPSATRINNKHTQHNGHLSLGVDLDSAGYLLAQQSFSYNDRGQPGLDREVPSIIAGQQRLAHQRVLRSLSQLRWEEFELGLEGASIQASLSHRFENSRFNDPNPALLAPIDDQFDDMSTALSLRPEWTVRGWGGDHHFNSELLLTRDAARASGDRLRERIGVAWVLRDNVRFFGRHLRIEPGVRLDWTDQSGSRLIPSLGIVVAPWPWLHVKGNVNRSYRNPSFQDLYLPDRGSISGNPDLEPERATNYDLGFELVLDSFFFLHNIRLATSLFRSEIDDSIIWVRRSPYKVQPINSGRSYTEGVEISSSVGLGPYITFSANHTELRARTRPDGIRLPGRAERETHVRIELGRAGVVKAVGEMQRTGSISVTESGNYLLPSRTSWNASLEFELSHLLQGKRSDQKLRRLWAHAAIDNISNIAIRDSLSFPQPGRNLRVGVEAQW